MGILPANQICTMGSIEQPLRNRNCSKTNDEGKGDLWTGVIWGAGLAGHLWHLKTTAAVWFTPQKAGAC